MRRKRESSFEEEGSYRSKRIAGGISSGERLDLDETSLQYCNPDDQYMYYNVRKDLKELFNSTNESGGGFSFLGEINSQNGHKAEDPKSPLTETGRSNPISVYKDIKYLFFHCDKDILRNRLDDNSFVRAQTMEELEAGWPDKRTAMKHSFRKRHKEALKVGKRSRYGAGQKNEAE